MHISINVEFKGNVCTNVLERLGKLCGTLKELGIQGRTEPSKRLYLCLWHAWKGSEELWKNWKSKEELNHQTFVPTFVEHLEKFWEALKELKIQGRTEPPNVCSYVCGALGKVLRSFERTGNPKKNWTIKRLYQHLLSTWKSSEKLWKNWKFKEELNHQTFVPMFVARLEKFWGALKELEIRGRTELSNPEHNLKPVLMDIITELKDLIYEEVKLVSDKISICYDRLLRVNK